jgi:hypothetical protein
MDFRNIANACGWLIDTESASKPEPSHLNGKIATLSKRCSPIPPLTDDHSTEIPVSEGLLSHWRVITSGKRSSLITPLMNDRSGKMSMSKNGSLNGTVSTFSFWRSSLRPTSWSSVDESLPQAPHVRGYPHLFHMINLAVKGHVIWSFLVLIHIGILSGSGAIRY